jgi:hypothetical protein
MPPHEMASTGIFYGELFFSACAVQLLAKQMQAKKYSI